jgi:hypothetical protein
MPTQLFKGGCLLRDTMSLVSCVAGTDTLCLCVLCCKWREWQSHRLSHRLAARGPALPVISEVSEAESNDPTVQCTEADPLEFTGARVPAVRLTMVPAYPKVRMEALWRESYTFRAAHPELDLPLMRPLGNESALPEGQVMRRRARPTPLCGSFYGCRCQYIDRSIGSTTCYALCARMVDHKGHCCCFDHAWAEREWEEWVKEDPVTRGAEEAADSPLSPTHWLSPTGWTDDDADRHRHYYKLAGPLQTGQPASLELI